MRMHDFYRFQILDTEHTPIDISGGTKRRDIRVDYYYYDPSVYLPLEGMHPILCFLSFFSSSTIIDLPPPPSYNDAVPSAPPS